ncbi:MAG: methyltransferase [Candidatus Omnitrophica bacterium]|nr:methyltransferase [Candidatus Omnitrophota bacterium]MCB9720171.1 methyltransferase [Candidatus Omnitrophota bacterium]
MNENSKFTHQILNHVNGSWIAQAVYAAVELGLPERLAHGPRVVADLAGECHVPVDTLARLLRALTTVDVFVQNPEGTFALTETGRRLCADHPESIRSWVIWWTSNLAYAWAELLYSIRTGKSARTLVHGVEGFEHLDQNSEQAAVFNQALVELTRLTAASVAGHYDFSVFRCVMDVGGGYGELLRVILHANPRTRGILFDRAHALGGALERFQQEGLAERCEFLEGDFFEEVPPGADALMLKSIIHDWPDEKAALILANCRKALPAAGKLLVIGRIMPARLEAIDEHRDLARSDLTMLVALGAGERSEDEYRVLLENAGFNVGRTIPVGMGHTIIEASPRP